MRTILFLVGLCAVAYATPAEDHFHFKVADQSFLEKQKDILQLFNYVNQPSYYKEFIETAKSFKWEDWSQWTKPHYAKEFYHYYKHGDHLPQGEIFSVFYPEHLKQAIALFRSFIYAKDYETFYKTAVWARQYVNEGMFVYSLAVAIRHSQFTDDIIMPPIYEIFPHYFFNDEVIYKAQQYKQHYWGTYEHEDEIKDKSYDGYTIQANYSGWYMNVHPEQSMTYFTEDVGVNAYYYHLHILSPFWLTKEDFSFNYMNRGEFFHWQHQQIMSRYYLERLSNGFGEIPHFEYEYPIETGYYPSMHYPNGMHFPSRPNHANLYYHGVHGKQEYDFYGNYTYTYTYVKDYERRLRDALDMGYFYTPEGKMVSLFDDEGFKTLGNLVESNAESLNDRFYGDLLMFSRHLLGYSYYPLDEFKAVPSALEHFETSMRDPMFYQMFKRIMYYFNQHQNYEGAYEQEELSWEGVKIQDIEVDRLMTYFDYYYSDLSNAVVMDEKEFQTDSFNIRARQFRLNHKPFNYKINIDSKTSAEAFVKVFIGPKYDEYGREIDIEDNRLNFYEFDRFHYTLNAGKNVIERNCHESIYYSQDRTTYLEMYEQVLKAISGGEQFKYTSYSAYYNGFPYRLMLPKGDFGGQTFQFYAIVVPYHAPKGESLAHKYVVDYEYSMSYPFDRPIEFEHEFFVDNSYFKDIVIYHKKSENEINASWNNY